MFSTTPFFFRDVGAGNYLHRHFLNRAAAKTIRQKYITGPQFNRRKYFGGINRTHHVQSKRISAMPQQFGAKRSKKFDFQTNPTAMFRHLPGDVQRDPEENYFFEKRVDYVDGSWAKRGRYQLHQIGGKTETFVCFRCGYPVKSKLVVVKDDNWDWRMCYHCYNSMIRNGQTEQ